MENEDTIAITTDPYAILLYGIWLTIYPLGDGTYKVFKESRKIAHLYAEIDNSEVSWESEDWVDADYITAIGRKIEEYEAVRGN